MPRAFASLPPQLRASSFGISVLAVGLRDGLQKPVVQAWRSHGMSDPVDRDPPDARIERTLLQLGETLRMMRWVLGASLAMTAIALAVAFAIVR